MIGERQPFSFEKKLISMRQELRILNEFVHRVPKRWGVIHNSFIIARFIWINGIRGYGDIALPMIGFDRSAKDILDVMERFSKAST